MADPKGFLKIKREEADYRPVSKRLKDYKDVSLPRSSEVSREQASRCMDCGTPFCHWGCPIGNYIPEWNDLLFDAQTAKAYKYLSSTNNFPEFTGRLCPALCEFSCVLGINDDPTTIRENELFIIEQAFKDGIVKPFSVTKKTGKKVAVIGSGPAGLSVADQLYKAGHEVTVFERNLKIGGILRYGIPDFKLEKNIIDRRIAVMKAGGVNFVTSTNIGKDKKATQMLKEFDAIALACGSRAPRDLKVEGRELGGIYFALDYLMQSNRRVSGEKFSDNLIDAKGKKVLVIGGGDTGSDCVGTANRQGAVSVTQIEVLQKALECRSNETPWPKFPALLKTTSSHEEGVTRKWSVLTKNFIGKNGLVNKVSCVEVDFSQKDEKGCTLMKEVPKSAFEIEADMVVLAIGFLHPEHDGPVKELSLELDQRGNVKTNSNFMTSQKGVFSAGDMRRGQSLIVWAISEGRKTARAIDEYLIGKSNLPAL
ncbi:MAG: glutamate synthase subunit beta [Endomicrobiales bacterium]|nr:glutamate synthase subunit beta [Endomicrobiales bacterium]